MFTLKAAMVGSCLLAFSSANAEGPALSGFIDATYNRNLQSGDTGPTTNQHHSFDAQANSFLLNAVHLAATGKSGEELSYAIEVDMGTDAAATNSVGLGAGNEMDLQEAYLTYRKPDGKLGFKAGKFVTYQGIEIIESGANPTITRGLLFGLAEPYTHTGIVATCQLTSALDVHAGLVNGWDLFVDNNTRPTGVIKLGYSGGDPLALTLSGYLGPEQADNTDNSRMSVDATGVTKSIKNLDLWFQANYGKEDKATRADTLPAKNSSWMGFGLQPLYHFSDKFCIGARYEYFKDGDGARTSTADHPLMAQVLQNISIAPAYYLTPSLLSRLEFRADMSDEDVFTDSDGKPTGQQLQVAAELIYSF